MTPALVKQVVDNGVANPMNLIKWDKVLDQTITIEYSSSSTSYHQFIPISSDIFTNNCRLVFIFDYIKGSSATMSSYSLTFGISNDGSTAKDIVQCSIDSFIGERLCVVAYIDIVYNTFLSNYSPAVGFEYGETLCVYGIIDNAINYIGIKSRTGELKNCTLKIYKQNIYNGIS